MGAKDPVLTGTLGGQGPWVVAGVVRVVYFTPSRKAPRRVPQNASASYS